MSTTDIAAAHHPHFVLRFRPLRPKGRSLAFPCNDHGCVDMDALEDRALRSYLYARAVIGFEYALPAVETLAC